MASTNQDPGNLNFSIEAIRVLKHGNILKENETVEELIDRVMTSVFEIESKFNTPTHEIELLKSEFKEYFIEKLVTLGSPTLTNAGRNDSMALSSCVAIPVDLREPFEVIEPLIEEYYYQNMGSGFNLSQADDPVRTILAINEHAIKRTKSESYFRYIGNMGNLDITHPKILEFVSLKTRNKDILHLNLSVNVTSDFINALRSEKSYRLSNGEIIDARLVWENIIHSAWDCGDPGLLFMDRFNADNPTPELGKFTTTAPCAEVGLAPGESCVFAYINLSKFCRKEDYSNLKFDFALLEKVVPLTTRALDNCLEISLQNYPSPVSKKIMSGKRKVGIGVCGFSDLLIKMDIPYASNESIQLLQDILVTISYFSKKESVILGKKRGSFGGILHSRYIMEENYLTSKYEKLQGSRIPISKWHGLDVEIKNNMDLRNSTTTALPPSGRSALILDASNSIEPLFSFVGADGQLRESVLSYLNDMIKTSEKEIIISSLLSSGSAQRLALPFHVANVLKRAIELTPDEQLKVVAAALSCLDEGASKTVNLRNSASIEDVSKTFFSAWDLGLKAISIYRDGSKFSQPETLS